MISVLPLVLAIILVTAEAGENTRQYTVYNKCPTPINLYMGGAVKDMTIATNQSVVKILDPDPGPFYTDANGGSPNGVGTIRAGFYNDFYYLVSDPNHANTGLQVNPTVGRTSGFCKPIDCDGRGCAQAFSQPPTAFPAPASSPRVAPPYYRCPFHTDYDLIFCPTGQFVDQGQPIKFDFYQNKCLDVRGAVFANGTSVEIYNCNGLKSQRWIINRGSTKVQVAGTNFCLDGGANPADGRQLKIWQCQDNLPAQQWFYTNDNRIALENQGFCTDLEDGNMTSTHKVQTWTCTDNNNNQVWTL